MNRQLIKEDTQMAKQTNEEHKKAYMKRYSTSLLIRKMQIKPHEIITIYTYQNG